MMSSACFGLPLRAEQHAQRRRGLASRHVHGTDALHRHRAGRSLVELADRVDAAVERLTDRILDRGVVGVERDDPLDVALRHHLRVALVELADVLRIDHGFLLNFA
jgi:hypothetical protein